MATLKIWTNKVAQEYIQSQDLSCDVSIKPYPLFDLGEGKVVKLRKLLYGLPDAADYCTEYFICSVIAFRKDEMGIE